jgi:pimeloyl-ACP methyl ester carboxylesterase
MQPAAAEHAAGSHDGSMEVGGFTLSAATLSALGQIDLQSGPPPRSASVLIIDGNSMPVARAWAGQLAEAGVTTQYESLPGLIQMLMTAPQLTSVPQEMISATCEWLRKFRAEKAVPIWSDRPSRNRSSLPLPAGASSLEPGSERAIWFGTDTALFGILTEPRPSEKRRRAVIMLNAGADFHIGASGIYVGLARHWAARGYVVLRMDFAGIGDSSTRPGRPDQEVFPPSAVQDMRDAIDWLRNQLGIRDFTLCGICSGAYHALRGAVEGLPVQRLLMVNPQNYFWKEGMSITGMQVSELVGNVAVYGQRMFAASSWKRLLTGQIDVGYIAKVYLRRALLNLESLGREIARRLRIRLPSDLGWELEQIAQRGVYVVFVFARGEPGVDLLKIQGGSSVARLGDRCRVHMIDGADHVFSKAAPRAVLQRILSDELFATAKMITPIGARLEHSS